MASFAVVDGGKYIMVSKQEGNMTILGVKLNIWFRDRTIWD